MAKRRSTSADNGHTVRLIGGQYRSRRLPVPEVSGLRPTGDRVRETLFNWLQNEVADAHCLDAFAGTGALGFEAASRYARSVTLVEPDRRAAKALESSRELLACETVQVVNRTFEDFLAHTDRTFDLVFVDPPFQSTDYAAVLHSLLPVLAPKAWVYIESPPHAGNGVLGDGIVRKGAGGGGAVGDEAGDQWSGWPPSWPQELSVHRDKTFGDVRVRLCIAGEGASVQTHPTDA